METAFLRRITDEPDDVVARLVFADWLREQDDSALNERGEFIHLQHALAQSKLRPEDRKRLIARQKELLERHRERWEEPLRGLVAHCQYRMGFAERVTLSAEQLVDHFAELTERTPVVRVHLCGLTTENAALLAGTESLSRLRELDLSGTWTSPAELRELIASPHLKQLRSLNLARTAVGDDGVRALIASPVFRKLRYLNLSRTGISVAGVHSLVNAIYNRETELRILVLRGAPRLQPGTFPPVPHGFPLQLRQSLRAQIGLDLAPPEELLAQLHATRTTLSPELRRWVEWLHTHGPAAFPRAVKAIPTPDALQEVFTLVCERRIVWRATRSAIVPSAIPLSADGRVDVAETVRLLTAQATRPEKETRALVACFLDLYVRHERGELPPDGKTR